MSKVIGFLDSLDDDELEEFEKDLKNGSVHKFLAQKKEFFKIKDKSCAACGNSVSEDCLVLIFGDPKTGIRKKAHFCGVDCLEYFAGQHLKMQHPKLKNSQ
jgi:hypothetical protein